MLDVYHSSVYLERVMQALGWDDQESGQHRKAWRRGEHTACDWLVQQVPKQPSHRGWNEEAATALRYLQARVDQMDYPTYRARGWPLGSGQIEGMNKHVTGSRMKRSGMR